MPTGLQARPDDTRPPSIAPGIRSISCASLSIVSGWRRSGPRAGNGSGDRRRQLANGSAMPACGSIRLLLASSLTAMPSSARPGTYQQLGRQWTRLEPATGAISRQDHRHAVVHAHGRVGVGDDKRRAGPAEAARRSARWRIAFRAKRRRSLSMATSGTVTAATCFATRPATVIAIQDVGARVHRERCQPDFLSPYWRDLEMSG